MKPFNFLLAFQDDSSHFIRTELTESDVNESDNQKSRRSNQSKASENMRPVAAYDQDQNKSTQYCFDRETGNPVPYERLKTYGEVLTQYHLHPEWKFDSADFVDSGFTIRRHIIATAIEHIGKEANRWEELWHLGNDPNARIIYGVSPDDSQNMLNSVVQACQTYKVRELANR